jgi:cytochrome-b5 reductase
MLFRPSLASLSVFAAASAIKMPAVRSFSSASAAFGLPKYSFIEPGHCQFDENFASAKLLTKEMIGPNTGLFTFQTPDKTKALNLPTCACILAAGGSDAAGAPYVRPYTPVSTNSQIGEFTLCVKIYEQGLLSKHIGGLEIGDALDFKHIKPNVKIQYPFKQYSRFVMIGGGTGITPLVQALHSILGNKEDNRKVVLLYGSIDSENILCEELLKDWEEKYPDQLKVVNVLSKEPEGSAWEGERGFINEKLFKKYVVDEDKGEGVFVCGPPPLYDALCGSRTEKEVSGLLKELGYGDDQVFKF